VTRLSLGIQSFAGAQLATLERIATPGQNVEALELARRSWSGQLGVDLMCGIPGQSVGAVVADVRKALDYQPDHVSLYMLTVEEETPLEARIRAGRTQPPDEGAVVDGWLAGAAELAAAGYEQYEISNFARDGRQCLHHLNTWRLDPYLGVGPAAASTVGGGDGVLRATGPRDLHAFLAGRSSGWGVEWEPVSPADLLFEHLMLGLRLSDGLDFERVRGRFGVDLRGEASRVLDEWVSRGDIAVTAERIRLTPRGRLFLNRLLVALREWLSNLDVPAARWP
jgi:oxygen-independent coproporphyrinogen-3 oxidase